jgi:hypothetical protein
VSRLRAGQAWSASRRPWPRASRTDPSDQVVRIFERAVNDGLQLDQIEVVTSPICRADSDCWDIVLYFFNPQRGLEEARRAYRFTADMSDIVPVLIGDVREWSVR